jgi:hypothetical protein
MYECTLLLNKLIEVKLLAGDPKEERPHPVFQIMDKGCGVNLVYYSASSKSST